MGRVFGLALLLAILLCTILLLIHAPGDAEGEPSAAPVRPVETCQTVSAQRFNAALKTRVKLGRSPRKFAHKPVCIRPHYRRVQSQINSRYRVCASRGDTKCRWLLRWKALSQYDRTWTLRIGACESGNNPRTDTGNGFLGAHQWVLSTWHMAGGSGSPVNASWHEQAVRAVWWRNKTSTMQWPACSQKLGYA